MKKANKYEAVLGGGYLTEGERTELGLVVSKICDNHADDSWWKIACSIKAAVDFNLNVRLSDEAFKETMEKEE